MKEKHKSKLPYEMLEEILKVYEFGKREHLERYPNDYIICRDSIIWANWEEIFDLRDIINEVKSELDTEAA